MVVLHQGLVSAEGLFAADDSTGFRGLWLTRGTAATTLELTGIVGASPTGLYPQDLTLFKGEVLFSGFNTTRGLWVTNGTSAGTQELTGISGVSPAGLDPSDLTVFNGEVLFAGLDTSGFDNLWVTDGTGSGTQELVGIPTSRAGSAAGRAVKFGTSLRATLDRKSVV